MTLKAYYEIAACLVGDLFDGIPGARPVRTKPKPSPKTKPKADPIPAVKPPRHYAAIDCPCCGRRVDKPTLEIIIDHYGIPPREAAVLEAVWRGRGYPVPSERIFDVMYRDDEDGGPSPSAMYSALKVELCRLRKRLVGSGVSVENVGYRQGYRLTLKD